MTPSKLKSIRVAAASDMSQAQFARALGYADADAYRKYESGARPVPHLLCLVMQAIRDGWRPGGWPGRTSSTP